MFYSGPTATTPVEKGLSEIAGLMRAQPTGNHMVYVNNAWAPAAQDPRVAAAMAAPPGPGGSPPPPLPPLPPVRPAVPVPPGPYSYYDGANWTQVSGEQLVALAVATPPGQEPYVFVNNQPTPLASVPELAAAVAARR